MNLKQKLANKHKATAADLLTQQQNKTAWLRKSISPTELLQRHLKEILQLCGKRGLYGGVLIAVKIDGQDISVTSDEKPTI